MTSEGSNLLNRTFIISDHIFPILLCASPNLVDQRGRRPANPTALVMASTARSNGGGLLEGLYRVIMRRTSVYATFVILGAFAGERVSFEFIDSSHSHPIGMNFEDKIFRGSQRRWETSIRQIAVFDC